MLQDILAVSSVEVLPVSLLNPLFARLNVSSLLTYIPQLSNHFNPGKVVILRLILLSEYLSCVNVLSDLLTCLVDLM